MRNFLILLITVISITQMEAQEKDALVLTADQLAISVVNLRKSVSNDSVIHGTGSFVAKGNEMYIVTATHVSKNMDKDAYVIIQGTNNSPVQIELSKLASPINWKDHPHADLSVLKLNPKKTVENAYLKGRFIPYDMIDTSKNALSRNTQLTIIGFPLGLGADGYFSPLTYRTFPSSGLITLNRFDTKTPQTFIILENPSIGGYSGGPVYDLSIMETGNLSMRGAGTKLHGFIHGTLSDDTGGKLSAITPAYYLIDLIK